MGYALSRIKDEYVDFESQASQLPAPSLYIIQFRRNITNHFSGVVPITSKGKWEVHGSYENERDMLREFLKICNRPNVINGTYTFRCLWPDGRTKESGTKVECLQ